MSRVGCAPWHDDLAVNWLEPLIAETELPQRIEEMLRHEVQDVSLPGIRAASCLLILLGDEMIWPTDDLDNLLCLAIEKLSLCVELERDEKCKSILEKEVGMLGLMRDKTVFSQRVEPICELWRSWLS
ncbi:MAG: hypothetical protein KC777_08185 [Cyanobacteria bacterium HKST-UBA02]|nr:hypothetical protein [Cyanobacteria bacterium HKST-UBA02]